MLNRIIHAGTLNQSGSKLKEYHKISKFYVADDSFQQALNILTQKRYLIISGDPGVGKSTLAGMLSLYFVGREYESIFLRKSVREGSNVWQEGTISSRDLSLIATPFYSSRFIEFQNPSIKDFAITYLKEREETILCFL